MPGTGELSEGRAWTCRQIGGCPLLEQAMDVETLYGDRDLADGISGSVEANWSL